MELFAPDFLPGVGMGDLESVAAICGLLGLAVTCGMLVAEGLVGTLVFVVSAIVLLEQKEDFGRSLDAAIVVLSVVLLAALARLLLVRRAAREEADLVGAAADAPETKARRAAVDNRRRWAWRLAVLATAWAGAVVGVAWAEWNEVPFRLEDGEAFAGLAIGFLGAAVGGDAAWRFLQGAVRAGGSAIIIGVVLCIVAYLLNAASVYVPFVGAVVFLLAGALALRLRRRAQQKHGGLRILA